VNPDVPAATAEGVYTDGQLTLTLPKDGTPTLKLGDKVFEVGDLMTGDGQLTGFFVSNGQSFKFTGVIKGDTIEFQSGTRKATLKRQGGQNPLDF